MENQLTHLSLFSGIGGLDLAAEWAGFKTIGQCEFADYPHKILTKHWPKVPKWRDIRDINATDFYRRTGQRSVDCISGGFPCQPHSTAGKRKASADDRDLWPEMRRVICEIKPRWVVGENVRGLLSSENGRFFARLLRDFSEMGYDVGWCVISASAVGAVHRRERVAIIAHDHSIRQQRREPKKIAKVSEWEDFRFHVHLLHRATEDYLAQSGILRSDDGIPGKVDRIKCLGNAVVPQQFYSVFKSIAEIEGDLFGKAVQGAENE